MKKYNFCLLACALALQFSAMAQSVNPAVEPDINISGSSGTPAFNTGVAIAPEENFVVVVNDEPLMSSYEINFFDENGVNFTANSGTGFDPDVAYYSNSDLVSVVYCHTGTVWMDMYELITGDEDQGIPDMYRKQSVNNVGAGSSSYPNVDINSLGDGVMCFQSGGSVVLRAFLPNTPSSTMYAPVMIGTGSQPDVVLSDNNEDVIVTYVGNNGDLKIVKLDYWALVSGSASYSLNATHPASGSNYSFPRVASLRNALFGDVSDFTVVAERSTVSGDRIEAFTYAGGSSVTNYLVNSGLELCDNHKPVVAYDLDQIIFAWSADYSGGCSSVSVPNPTRTDVLYTNYDANSLTSLSGGDFFELNQLQGAFNQSNVSITGKYDGNFTITSTSEGREAATYTSNTNAYWKKRDFGTSYKNNPLTTASEESDSDITLLQNPVHDYIRLKATNISALQVSVTDVMGRSIDLNNRLNNDGTEVSIYLGDLSKGLYIVTCNGENHHQQVLKVIHK